MLRCKCRASSCAKRGILKHGIPIARPFPVNYRTSSVPHTRTRVRQRTGTKLQQQTLGTDGSHVSFDRAPEEGSYRQRIWNFGDFVFLFAESKAWLLTVSHQRCREETHVKDTGTPGDHRTSVGKSCPDVTTGRRIALSTESVQE